MFRLIREIKPEFVIGENVQGIINIQNGMVLRQVQDDLEGEGFEVQCFLIPASGIGAWHQRYRVWIVGHSNENGLLREVHKAEIVSNANTRLSIGKNKEIQARRDSITCSSEDVPNTNHTRGRASKHGIEREGKKVDEGWKRQPQPESSRHDENVSNTTSKRLEREFGKKLQRARVRSTNSSEDVSNTNKSLRGGGRTISLGRENKVWRFRVEEEGIRDNVWIETVGRNAVYREGETDVSQSNNERQQEFNISKESRKKNISDWGYDTDETKQTWWQIESDLCGVPNGISYELDKDRANRIKTLGNAIVPQIAREFGLAIKKVLVDEDII
jgi:site-specific DNA-cytosine methylase